MIGGNNLRQLVLLLSPDREQVTVSLLEERTLNFEDLIIQVGDGVRSIHVIIGSEVNAKGVIEDARRTRDMINILGCLSMVIARMFEQYMRALYVRDPSHHGEWYVTASSTCGFSVCTEIDDNMPYRYAHVMRNIVRHSGLDQLTQGLSESASFWGDGVKWSVAGPQNMAIRNYYLESSGVQPFGLKPTAASTGDLQVFSRDHVTMVKAAVSELTHYHRPNNTEDDNQVLVSAFLISTVEISFNFVWSQTGSDLMCCADEYPESFANNSDMLRSVLYANNVFLEHNGFSRFQSYDYDGLPSGNPLGSNHPF
jgi:hypothetical protein